MGIINNTPQGTAHLTTDISAALETRFKGRCPWKKGRPMLLQTLEAVGRAQPVALDGAVGWRA